MYKTIMLVVMLLVPALGHASQFWVGSWSSEPECEGVVMTLTADGKEKGSLAGEAEGYAYRGDFEVSENGDFTATGIERRDGTFSKIRSEGNMHKEGSTMRVTYDRISFDPFVAFRKTQDIPQENLSQYAYTAHPCDDVEHVEFVETPVIRREMQGRWKVQMLKMFSEMEDYSDNDVVYDFKQNGTLLKIVNGQSDGEPRVFELRWDVRRGLLLVSSSDSESSSLVAWPLKKTVGDTYHFPTIVLQKTATEDSPGQSKNSVRRES